MSGIAGLIALLAFGGPYASASQTRLFALDPEFLLVADASDARLLPATFAESSRGAFFEPGFAGIGGGRAEREAGGFFASGNRPVGLYFADRASTKLDLGISMSAETDVVTQTPRGSQGHAWRPSLALGALFSPDKRFRIEAGFEWSWFLERQTIAGIRWDSGVISNDSQRRPSYAIHARTTVKIAGSLHAVAAGWYEWNDLTETGTWGVIQPSGINIVYRVVFTDLSERKGGSLGFTFSPSPGITAFAGAAVSRTRVHRARNDVFFQYPAASGVSRTLELDFPVAGAEAAISDHWTLRAGFVTRVFHLLSDGLAVTFSPYATQPHVDDLSWLKDGGAGLGWHDGAYSADISASPGIRRPALSAAARVEF